MTQLITYIAKSRSAGLWKWLWKYHFSKSLIKYNFFFTNRTSTPHQPIVTKRTVSWSRSPKQPYPRTTLKTPLLGSLIFPDCLDEVSSLLRLIFRWGLWSFGNRIYSRQTSYTITCGVSSCLQTWACLLAVAVQLSVPEFTATHLLPQLRQVFELKVTMAWNYGMNSSIHSILWGDCFFQSPYRTNQTNSNLPVTGWHNRPFISILTAP